MACSSTHNKHGYQQTHQGKILGYAFDEYNLQLLRGDKLTANLNTSKLEVIIYSPINMTINHQQPIEITSDGEYILRVLMPRASARKSEEHQYQLSIAITPH
jgi:hypothetical protein